MKHISKFLLLACLSTATAWAGPVQMTEINGDAKWLLHLDMDRFKASKSGEYIMTQLLEPKIKPKLNELKEKLKFDVDPNKILEKINSITIYGTDFKNPKENAVLMVKAEPDLQAAVVGLLAGFALAGTNSPLQVTQEQVGNVTLYSQKPGQVSCAVLPGKVLAWSASYEAAKKAAKVLSGKAETLEAKKTFAEFPQEKSGFFFLASAEGFNEDAALPPQAKLLQMADGGQLALGEDADQMVLNLALKAKTSEIVTQMQQVVQGLIAMVSLGQPENKDLAKLVQGIKVSATEKVVSVRVEYPVDKVIQQLEEQVKKKHQNAGVQGARAMEQQTKIVEQQIKLTEQQLKDVQKNGADADQVDALKEQVKALKEELVELKNHGDDTKVAAQPGGKSE